ncbi:hypothetical protein GCM10027280_45480 [Micromonospora polyrhachis]|uniref:Terminase small subunit n=1 Tax=Micromonospora polyrhachis TaxID=1282883 RepID=A0A7W7WQ60_9ACTN|nr:hypothetical protein [Micromonospora polyrhachis]MBB4958938.1 hypothetical protein [Micromonospora polyrhachis]
MARGGARNRSGPTPDPKSARSDRRSYKLTALPAEGYDGEVPDFPLPDLPVWHEYFVDKQKVRELDQEATEDRSDRERELWRWAWRTPQACAWSTQPWRWHAVAMWVRTSALCESSDATAADKNSLHRFADQIGLSPAGMKENGWAIAVDEVAAKREQTTTVAAKPKRRLRAVGDE